MNKSKKSKTDQPQGGAYAAPLAQMPAGNLLRHFSDDDILFVDRQIGIDICSKLPMPFQGTLVTIYCGVLGCCLFAMN